MSATIVLMNELRTALPGALDSQIRLQVFNAVDEACRIASLYKEVLDIQLVEGDTTYVDLAPAGTEIISYYSVSHLTLDVSGAIVETDTLHLLQEPSAQDALSPLLVAVSLAPHPSTVHDNAYDMAGWLTPNLWERHREMFLEGALARMMAQPAKPYTSERLATYHGRKYRSMLSMARAQARVNNVPGAQGWSFPRFGK